MTVIEIKPHRWGWKVFEAPSVDPVFPEKRQAINYAENRAWFRSGEIRILDSSGRIALAIPVQGLLAAFPQTGDQKVTNKCVCLISPPHYE